MRSKHWFNCRIRYQSLDESGQEIKAMDDYMLSAYNYTEAEANITGLMNGIIRGQFEVVQITKTNFIDAVFDEKAERWWRVKISLTVMDEELGKEKQTTQYVAVEANDIREANEGIKVYMRGSGSGYLVTAISFIKVKEVFRDDPVESTELARTEMLGRIMAAHELSHEDVDPETGEIRP